ncbi:MAG: ketoacyl-ACP synthase III [Planctomycetes bacterium]|nr:ketoacyl-ACP synthase III [Planctomycetota bacterium]
MSGPNPPASHARPRGIRIAGTGLAVPDTVLTNQDLAKRVETSDEWIVQRTGIRQRYIAENGVNTLQLGSRAVKQALDRAGMTPKQVDLLLCATITPEMCCPSTAARIVSEIGAVPAGAMDISAACSGFVYGMNMAAALIQTGLYKTIAVVGVETLSRITDWANRKTCVLFGDGGGAAILTASDDAGQGCVYQAMWSNGDSWGDLYCPREASDVPASAEFSGAYNTLQMNGREVYKFAVGTLLRCIEETLAAAGVAIGDLAMIIPHQSNARILESAREKLGLPADKLYINIDRYGNTSAASVPICLHELVEAGKLKTGDLVLLVGIGGGLTWATSLWKL